MEIGNFLTGLELVKRLQTEANIWERIKFKKFSFPRMLLVDIGEIAKYCVNNDANLARIQDPWFGSINKQNILAYLFQILFCKINNQVITLSDDRRKIDIMFIHLYTHRKDSNQNVENVVKDNDSAVLLTANFEKRIFTKKLNWNIFESISYLFRILKIFFNVKGSFNKNWLVRLYLSGKCVEYRRWLKYIEEKFSNYNISSAVFYADWRGYENAICQLFQTKGITTFGMQHAVYPVNKPEEAFLGDIPWENFTADYLLCWGRYLTDKLGQELKKYDENRLLEVCHPCRNLYGYQDNKSKNEIRTLWILASHKRLEKSNLSMMNISKKVCEILDLNFYVKLHPGSVKQKYIDYIGNHPLCKEVISTEKTVRELCQPGTIFVAHSTTAYHEVIARGCPCFQYKDEDFREGPSLGYFFTGHEELIGLIKQFIDDPESFHIEMRELADYVFGEYTDRPSEIYNNKILTITESIQPQSQEP